METNKLKYLWQFLLTVFVIALFFFAIYGVREYVKNNWPEKEQIYQGNISGSVFSKSTFDIVCKEVKDGDHRVVLDWNMKTAEITSCDPYGKDMNISGGYQNAEWYKEMQERNKERYEF